MTTCFKHNFKTDKSIKNNYFFNVFYYFACPGIIAHFKTLAFELSNGGNRL